MSCLEGVTAEGSSALHIAASRGYLELVVMICTQDISLIKARNNLLDTPLICAARAGHAHVVNYLIKCPACFGPPTPRGQGVLLEGEEAPLDPVFKAWNSSGATAMHEAVRNGHESVLEKLMSWDTRLAAVVDGRGASPLYMAAVSSRVDMVNILIRESCDGVRSQASYAGPDGQTALHAAVYADNAQGMSESLLRWEPTLALKADSSGRTALHHAASAGKTRVVKLLLRNNLLPAYTPDDDGLFPVHAAAIAGESKVMRELMKTCPSSDELVDKKQRNTLHCAVEHGSVMSAWHICRNPKFARMMNAGDADGNTPLHLAIKHGHMLIFYFLMMDTSVDVTVTNNEGQTPRDVAIYKLFSDYTYLLLVANGLMNFSLFLCGSPRSYQTRKLLSRKESANYTDVSQSLLYISVFIAAGSFAAALAVPGGYIAEGENAGMPVFARTIGLLRFVSTNSLSFYFSTMATCLLVHGSLTIKYTSDHRNYLVISALLVWYAVLYMLCTFTSVVRLTLYPSNCHMEGIAFYSSVLVDVVINLGLSWPIVFVAFPRLLRVQRQLRTRRLSRKGILEASSAALLAFSCVWIFIILVESILREVGLSPRQESC